MVAFRILMTNKYVTNRLIHNNVYLTPAWEVPEPAKAVLELAKEAPPGDVSGMRGLSDDRGTTIVIYSYSIHVSDLWLVWAAP